MDSTQTLHDFVLNLLTNPEARSAFQLDPEAALHQAGLGDVTAADVQDVVPLVVDYAAVQGSAGLAPAGADLGGAVDSDPTSVIGQLQAVTQQLALGAPSPSADGNLAAAGAIAVDSSGLAATAGGALGMGGYVGPAGVSADLSGTQDVAATLDSGVVEGVVEPVNADATGTVGSTVDGTLGSTVDGTLEPVDGLLAGGSPVEGVLGTADSAVGPLTSGVGDPTGLLDSPEDGSSLVDGSVGTVDEVVDGAGVGGLLEGSASASGSAEASAQGSAGDGLLDDATDILF